MRCDVNISLRRPGATRTWARAPRSRTSTPSASSRRRSRSRSSARPRSSSQAPAWRRRRASTTPTATKRARCAARKSRNDYRYFPEPDLLPVRVDDGLTSRACAPHCRSCRPRKPRAFARSHGLTAYDASVLCASRELADYFEQVVAGCGDAKTAANWVTVELLGLLNRENLEIGASKVSAAQLGGLIRRILDQTISGKIAKTVFEAMWHGEGERGRDHRIARGCARSPTAARSSSSWTRRWRRTPIRSSAIAPPSPPGA